MQKATNSTPKATGAIWRFFASVKLALITLIILASTSILGTLIKQRQEPSYYVQEYGQNLARLFDILDISNMYSSWWFIVLLCLFAVNLVVCSIQRLPDAWRLVVQDNLSTDLQQLEKMSITHRAYSNLAGTEAADRMQRFLVSAGWKKTRRLDRDGAILLFTQKGAWTRLGVYVVHLSILIILTGALLGTFFGFQAYVFLPEGRSTNSIFLRISKNPVPLDFKLQNNRFTKTFYANGMIKEFRADLTVFDPKRKTPLQKSIIVNDPLSYQGITFYLADSFPLEEYLYEIRNRVTGMEQAFRVPAEQEVPWPESSVTFRIEELTRDQDDAVQQAKIRFTSGTAAESSLFWVKDNETVNIGQPGEEFTVSFRQLYSILLMAIKDPGVLIVYFGCCLMIVGLAISFFLSHRRVWVRINPKEEQGSLILLSATSNKNKPAFARQFQEELVDRLQLD